MVSTDVAESPAAELTDTGRALAAATLVLGAGFQVVAFFTMPEFDDTAARLDWIAANPGQAELSKVFDILAVPFLAGSAVVYYLLSRRRSPRLAFVGAALLAAGMVGLGGVQGLETLEFALVEDGRFDRAALADLLDNISTPPAVALLLLFIGGAFLGLILSSVALWRSRAVPRAAVLLILLFIVFDLPLAQSRIAHVLSFLAALWIAVAVLQARPASDARRS
jgi:hypothetical protein